MNWGRSINNKWQEKGIMTVTAKASLEGQSNPHNVMQEAGGNGGHCIRSLESMLWALTVLWKRIKPKISNYISITNIYTAVLINIVVQQKTA